MTNNEFDADTEHLDDDFAQEDGADEAAEAAPAPVTKKSGGGFGKILLVLIVLGGGGVLGAAKMGFVKLPIAIPGITPKAAAPVVHQAATTPVKKDAVHTASLTTPAQAAEKHEEKKSGTNESAPYGVIDNGPNLSVSPSVALPAPVVAEKKALPELTAPPLKQAPAAPPVQMFPGLAPPSQGGNTVTPPASAEQKNSASVLMPQAIGNDTNDDDASRQKIVAPFAQTQATQKEATSPVVVQAPAPVAAPASASADTKQLEDRLNALEAKFDALNESQVKKSDIEALQASVVKLQQEIARGVTRNAVSQTPAVAHHHAAHKTEKAPSVSKTHWVLKSAKPGTAWVSAEGTDDLRTVSVGDSLPGIGKITSVSVGSDGHWAVIGTHGKINQ